MLKRILPLLLAVFCALALVSAASAARGMKLGIYDSAQALGNTSQAFQQFSELRAQVVRVTLNWRDVSLTKPAFGTFNDPASYRWVKPGVYDYDQTGAGSGGTQIDVIFTILYTPAWAGGGTRGQLAPSNMAWLQAFARAAATRYSGVYADSTGALLPRVRYWTAWNEPNSPNFLRPQYKRVNGRWVIWSARRYAKMCTAVFRGIHAGEVSRGKVACGVTNPGGNNSSPWAPRRSDAAAIHPRHEGREAEVRRLRAPPVCEPPARDPYDPAAIEDADHAREPRRPHPGAEPAGLGLQARLADRVRLPDEAS